MKSRIVIFSIIFILFFAQIIFAQALTGGKFIPGDYSTIAAAITDLNSKGVGSGGVVFNVAANHTESTTSALIITATGTVSNTITFIKNGSGNNPKITRNDGGSYSTSVKGGQGDAIIRLDGTDYITFNGIDLASGSATIEYGYMTNKPVQDNACKNVTIQNCSINMNKSGIYNYTVIGIYISNGPTSTISDAGVTVITPTGTNSDILVRNNTITNVYTGIFVRGYSNSYYYDHDITIGEVGAGNTIQNFGGSTSGIASGVHLLNLENPIVSYNSIDNAQGGSAHGNDLYGIYFETVSGNLVANYNSIKLSNNSTSDRTYYIINMNDVTSETINNNTFSAGTLSSSGNVALIYSTNATNTFSFSNNQTSGTINRTGTSNILYCIYKTGSPASGSETINNNNFSNITVTGSSRLYGIYVSTSATQTRTIDNNILDNWTGGTGISYGIYSGTVYSNQVSNNTVSNITMGDDFHAINVSTGSSDIYGNIISNITTSGTPLYGIVSSGSGTTNCYRNKISNLTSNSTSTTLVLSGISISSGTQYIYNNYIYELKTPSSGTVLTTTAGLKGIQISGGTSINIFYNTVYLDATSTGTNFGNATIYSDYNTNIDFRNNIFINKSTPNGTGKTVAFQRSYYTNLSKYSNNSNNNLFYAGTPGTNNLIYYDGTNSDQTLSEFQTRVGTTRDAASITESTPFINTSSSPYDMHISTTIPTLVESAGTVISSPIAISTDYYTTSRHLSKPDVGAEEGSFIRKDLTPPAINYTLLTNTSSTTDRILDVEITDEAGVPTSGSGLPMLYWNVNNGSWTGVQGVSIGGNHYQFTFGAGVTLNDVIKYYIVAQDMATTPSPNVIASPSTGASGYSTNPPAVSTPPTAPNQYTIVGSLSGDLYVGEGQLYTSLTQDNSTGLFKALNEKFVTGNINVYITSDLIETGDVALNQTNESGAGNYTITFKSNATTMRTISGQRVGGLIRFNGVDRITVDGRVSGSGNYLKFNNYYYAVGYRAAVFQIISLGTGKGTTDITIRNCSIDGGNVGSSLSANYTTGIYIGGSNLTSGGDDNDNISIIDNIIVKSYTGISAKANATGVNNNIVITGNTIGSNTVSEYIGNSGINVEYADNLTIENNTIFNIVTGNNYLYGLYIGSGVVNGNINKNKIYNLVYIGSGGYGGRGIYLNSENSSSNILVSNNVLYGIGGLGETSVANGIIGIAVVNGGGYKLYYNSVNLYGEANRTASTISAALYVSSSVTSIDIRNNVFVNKLINTGSLSDKAYSIYSAANNSIYTNINYNYYYAPTDGNYAGVLGYLGTDRTTISDWRTASGQDVNSFSSDPTFKADDNLQPLLGSPLLQNGTPVDGVTTDYNGVTRHSSTPSIGAYETNYVFPAVDWANLHSPSSSSISEGLKLSITARVQEPGLTGNSGTHSGIQCWIGWNTVNNNPNTWSNWTLATRNASFSDADKDEYTAQIAGNIQSGTYYYASRFLITEGQNQYGGYSTDGGNFWDGTNYVSGMLTVENGTITWANLQSPAAANIIHGETVEIKGRVFVDGVTNQPDSSIGIQAWIGINSVDSDPSTWSEFCWIPAVFNTQQGNNHEYKLTVGLDYTPGTYYYATRYKLVNDSYVYGGYSSGGGGIWDVTTYKSGTLTINQFITNTPYFQNFDGVPIYVLPGGWAYQDVNNDGYYWYPYNDNQLSGNNSLKVEYNYNGTTAMNDWIFSPGLNLKTGVTYQVVFWYAVGSATYPEKLEVKWGSLQTAAGMTSSAIFSNTNLTNEIYQKGVAEFTPSSDGVYYVGWHGFSDADMYVIYLDDIFIRVKPTATSTKAITSGTSGGTSFDATGVTVTFNPSNLYDITLTIEKILSSPGGTLPLSLVNLAPIYWQVTTDFGHIGLDETFCLTLDLTGIEGINNYSTLRLLRRDNPNGTWVVLGVPSDITNAPIVKWCNINSFSEFAIAGYSENPLPVELQSFSINVRDRNVNLNWRTATEVNVYGYEIEKRFENEKEKNKNSELKSEWNKIGFVKGFVNSNSSKDYSFVDKNLNSGKYFYRLKMMDNDGTFKYSDELMAEVGKPSYSDLKQNYPNSFNPTTKIEYQLANPSKVYLEIFNMLGERVSRLIDEENDAGYYLYYFDATKINGGLSSGVYFYRMIVKDKITGEDVVKTKKMMLVK